MTPVQDTIASHYPLRTPYSKDRLTLIIIICSHFTVLLAMGLFRHWGNMSSLNDLGVFDQIVWKTLHGQWIIDNSNFPGQPMNWLGGHFNVVLLLFVPLYAIWPAAEWFAIAQAISLSAAAWPIFLLASKVHGSERTGLLWAAVYLFNPFLLSAAAWDFHPVTLAVPLIATALLAVEKKDFRLLVICCLCMLLVQVQFGLTVAGFGALWGIKHRSWKGGLILSGAGLLHTVLVLGVFVPALSPSGTHIMITDPTGTGQNSRYGWLGGSLYEIFGNIFLHPWWLLKTVVSMDRTISYLMLLSLPFLGLFFAAPVWLLPAFADLAANTLSANPMPRGIISYHSVTLVPLLTVASIYGARRFTPLLAKGLIITPAKLVLLLTLGLSYAFAPLPLPGAANLWRPLQWLQCPDPALQQIRMLVANSTSMSVQANAGAHFSQHQQVFRYPYKVDEADTIILWLDTPTGNILPHNSHMIGTLAHHLQMNPAEYLASIECLLRDPGYKVMMWQNPWLVINRGAGDEHTNQSVQRRIEALCTQWGITPHEYENAKRACQGK